MSGREFGNRSHSYSWDRLDLMDITFFLPNEVHIKISGRRAIHGNLELDVKLGQCARIPSDECVDAFLQRPTTKQWNMRVTRGERWVKTITQGVGGRSPLVGEGDQCQPTDVILHEDTEIGCVRRRIHNPVHRGLSRWVFGDVRSS